MSMLSDQLDCLSTSIRVTRGIGIGISWIGLLGAFGIPSIRIFSGGASQDHSLFFGTMCLLALVLIGIGSLMTGPMVRSMRVLHSIGASIDQSNTSQVDQ